MPNTAIFSLPYPDATDAPDGPTQFQDLAEAVETQLSTIYAGIEFGGAVTVGGNLTTAGTLSVGSTSTMNGNVSVSGDVAATGAVTADGNIAAVGDVTARGAYAVTLVDGKRHTGSLVDTTSNTNASWENIIGANVTNVPVVAGHAYKAEYQFAVTSSVANDRIRYSIWNGTVGDTQLGSISPIVRVVVTGTYTTEQVTFLWEAPNTETIANLNLAMLRYSGTGTVETRVEVPSFMALVYDLGPASAITNL